MQSWICRILSFVFLANVLFPVPVNSQNYVPKNYLPKEVEKKLYYEMARQRFNYMQVIGDKENWDLHIKKLEKMPKSSFYSKDLVDVHLLIEKDLMDKVYNRAQIFPSKIQNSLLFPKDKERKKLKPNDLFRRPKFTGKRFLEILSAEGSFDFIEQWLDPYAIEGMYEPIVISYAAETVGAIIDTALRDRNQEEINFLLERLPLTQQHILYRIDYIEYMYGEIENMPQALMASLGSLRITIAEIRRFYQQIREKDPLSDRVTNPSVLYKNQSKKFLSEIEHFLSLKLEDGSALQQKAVIWVDYATTYFIKTGQYDKLEELVNLLDKSMDKTEFIQEGSPLLQSLFISIFENYVQMERHSKEIISLLKEFSDDGYSVTTRVLALESASNISRYFLRPSTTIDEKNRNINTNNSKEFSLIPDISHKGKFVNGKFIAYMPYRDRVDFAKKVSKIYCPATGYHYDVEDYGLKSYQLAAFADKLAWIYDGFIDISTSVVSTPGFKSYQNDLKDNDRKNCVVKLHNQPNKRMQDSENTVLFFRLVGETLLWVYAGEIFVAGVRFIGTAYRSIKALTLANPKMIKALITARQGRKVTSALLEARKALKYANGIKNMESAGVQVAVTAKKAGGITETGLEAGMAENVASNYTTFVAKNMAQLRTGQEHWWQRLGSKVMGPLNGEIEAITFVQPLPGFTVNVGTASVGGTRLARGIHNYDDWRYLQRLLRTSTEQGGSVPFKLVDLSKPWKSPNWVFYGSKSLPMTGRELLSHEMKLSFATQQAVKEGKFDLWLINNGVGYNISRTADLSTLPWKGSQNFFVAPRSNIRTFTFPKKSYQGRLESSPINNVFLEGRYWKAFDHGDDIVPLWAPSNLYEGESLARHFLSKPNQWGVKQPWGGFPKDIFAFSSPNEMAWLPAFTNRLLETGNIHLLFGNLIGSGPFWKSWEFNLKLFGTWAAMDLAVYPFMNNWVENKTAAQYDELLAPYKDTFEQVKQDQKEQNNGVEPAPAPLGIYDAVNAAQKGDFRGALISFPMLGILHSKPGQFLFGERSFVAEKDRVFYPHLAAKLDLSHALYTREKTKMAKQSIEQIEAERTTQVAQAMAVGGESAAQEMQSAYDAFIAKMKALKEDNIPAWKWDKELKKERQEVEYLVLLNAIRALEQQRDDDLLFLSEYGDDWVAKGKKVYDAYINALKEVLLGGDLLSKKTSKKLEKLSEQFVQEMISLKKDLPSRSRSASTYYTDEMFDMASYIQFLEDQKYQSSSWYSPEDGAKLVAIYDKAIKKLEKIANSTGLDQQTKAVKRDEIINEFSGEVSVFQREHRVDEMRFFEANVQAQLSMEEEEEKPKYQALIDAYRSHLKVIVEDSSLSEADRNEKVSQFWKEFAVEWGKLNKKAGEE